LKFARKFDPTNSGNYILRGKNYSLGLIEMIMEDIDKRLCCAVLDRPEFNINFTMPSVLANNLSKITRTEITSFEMPVSNFCEEY
jgi:hypothetical protein